ncbi:MAG: hypothetical protein GY870_18080 [archaeon]|nr:hypothetical protein [archaeon]
MTELDEQEKFILKTLSEHDNKMNYKDLQIACENEFEGVRLILKKMKEKGYVEYEGMIPGFSAVIELLKTK